MIVLVIMFKFKSTLAYYSVFKKFEVELEGVPRRRDKEEGGKGKFEYELLRKGKRRKKKKEILPFSFPFLRDLYKQKILTYKYDKILQRYL